MSYGISDTLFLYQFIARTFDSSFFFFNDTATTEIYTLSLHDALPILVLAARRGVIVLHEAFGRLRHDPDSPPLERDSRSEEHTSELQSRRDLVCRLLLEKKKTKCSMKPNKSKVSLLRLYSSTTVSCPS